MKKLKDFIYCDSVLTTRTVFYLVAVGTSARDAAAWRYVRSIAKGRSFFVCDHGLESQAFIDRCAASIYGRIATGQPTSLLRRVLIPVHALASFLRKNPPALLNSAKISQPENKII